jgi:hypothetical protein
VATWSRPARECATVARPSVATWRQRSEVVWRALLRCVIPRLRRSMIGMLRWSDGGGEVFEGDAEPVVVGDVGSDVVVAAAQVLHQGMAGGEDPR